MGSVVRIAVHIAMMFKVIYKIMFITTKSGKQV